MPSLAAAHPAPLGIQPTAMASETPVQLQIILPNMNASSHVCI